MTLSKLPKRTLLSFYLAAMLVLDLWILAHAWAGITQGLPDFTIFYTAGKILQAGRAPDLYDNSLQKAIQESVTPVGLEKRGSILPYNHPPFEAVLFLPLSHFSYLTAYLIWAGVNVALLIWFSVFLRQRVSCLADLPLPLWIVAVLTFDPLFIALIQGQDSILLLCCFALAYACFLRCDEFWEGIWLSLGLFKFNLVLPFVLPLLLVRRKKLVSGLLATALGLFLLSFFLVGWRGLLNYPAYVWSTEQDRAYLWNTAHANQPNLRGLCTSLFGNGGLFGTGVLILLSGIVLLVMTALWKRASSDAGLLPRVFAAGLIGTILLSFHLYLHDMSLLLLAMVVALEYFSRRPDLETWIKVSVYGSIGVLFFSPLYLLLTLRFKQLELMALVVLVLFIVLAWDALRQQPTNAEI